MTIEVLDRINQNPHLEYVWLSRAEFGQLMSEVVNTGSYWGSTDPPAAEDCRIFGKSIKIYENDPLLQWAQKAADEQPAEAPRGTEEI